MNETSRKIVFQGRKTDYYKWADAMWSRGYSLCITDVMKSLNVSLSWIKHTLLKEILYVNYSYKYLYQRGIKTRVTTYINHEDLVQWIEQVADFKRQTELIDLYSYLSLANQKKAEEALKMYRKIIKESNIGYNPGIIPEKVLQYINTVYYVNFEPKNLSCVKRSEVAWKDVEPFNIFEAKYYFPEEYTAELFYRDAFMKGDTKITIGKKKTIFLRNKVRTEKMKMPFLIPYNKKIIVQNRTR